MTQGLYPPGPSDVPADLSRATSAYRRHAWLAVVGLLAFVALYGSLCIWFTRTAYECFSRLTEGGLHTAARLFAGCVAALLAAFLIRALFGVTRGLKSDALEITQQAEPELFRFLNRLADDTGAPRPHRVFLSPRVNAAVFYDLSILNLLFPSKKNLEIGLGLVNALPLSDFKAVLAHEMGHFAQRSMAVGRWVYVSSQIAGNIVARRDWFDRALSTLSSVDLRIAWLGWLMRLIVWSLRSIVDTVFQLLVLAQRALSREMEFQADLVAVTVTGSDALVHALRRLSAADAAWDRALHIAATERVQGRRIPDLFALQTRVGEHLRSVVSGEEHAAPPALPEQGRAEHRVFKEQLAHAPRMWSTHPSNREREDNAKRRYVAAPLDERSAWLLFRDPDQVRERATRALLEQGPANEPVEVLASAAALAVVDERFASPIFDRKYRGVYFGRSTVLRVARASELYSPPPSARVLGTDLDGLYTPALAQQLREWRTLEEELGSLRALHEGILDAPGGVIRHRGRSLQRKELPAVIGTLERERQRARALIDEHDRRCRTLHRAAASDLGQGWPEYLNGLLTLLHYAGHAEADVDDARGHLLNVLAIVTVDGRVTAAERTRLVAAGTEVYQALRQVFEQRVDVRLPGPVAERLGVEGWRAALPQNFELPAPSEGNIGGWLEAVDSWHQVFSGPLGALERSALECLLDAEAQVESALRSGAHPGAAPEPPRVPETYRVRLEGSERERQRRLHWWDRFLIADGFFPALGRLAVSAAVVGSVLAFGGSALETSVVVHNGLSQPVDVSVGGVSASVAPAASVTLQMKPQAHTAVEARIAGRLLEAFETDLTGKVAVHVYNVAGASALIEWTAVYGNRPAKPERVLGAPRWSSSDADLLFEAPPRSVSTRGGGEERSVLQAVDGVAPAAVLDRVSSAEERAQLIGAHARWDGGASDYILTWLELAAALPEFPTILRGRLQDSPREVAALRSEQDAGGPAGHAQVCARHRALAAASPADMNLEYVALRCIEPEAERAERFLSAFAKNPGNPWLANAAGLEAAERGDWHGAVQGLSVASKLAPLRDSAGLQLARILRLEPQEGELPAALRQRSPAIAWLQGLETGSELPAGPYQAYAALARGKLDAAVERADPDPELLPRVLRLAAASDGATPALVRRALQLPLEQGLDRETLWAALPLAVREQQAIDAFKAHVEQVAGAHANVMWRLVQTPEEFAEPAALERALVGLPLELRAEAYMMGSVLRGAAAPAEWRKRANALLFASERPHFH